MLTGAEGGRFSASPQWVKEASRSVRLREAPGWIASWWAFRALAREECRRILKSFGKTILAPASFQLLQLWWMGRVQEVRLGRNAASGLGPPAFVFLGWFWSAFLGLGCAAWAYWNVAHSIFSAREQGWFEAMRLSAARPTALLFGFLAGGLFRAACVAAMVVWVGGGGGVFPRVPAHPGLIVILMGSSALSLGCLGLLMGLWARKHEDLAFVLNFILTPLVYAASASLGASSGAWWSRWNPLTYYVRAVAQAWLDVPQSRLGLVPYAPVLWGSLGGCILLHLAAWGALRRQTNSD